MAQRKIDLIKGLQNQLDHQNELVKVLRAENETLRDGEAELRLAFSAIMAGMAIRHGERREEDGKLLGYRLALPRFSVRELEKKYDVRVEITNDPVEYVIGVIPKEEEDGES